MNEILLYSILSHESISVCVCVGGGAEKKFGLLHYTLFYFNFHLQNHEKKKSLNVSDTNNKLVKQFKEYKLLVSYSIAMS